MRWQDDPAQHILAVGGLYPLFSHFAHLQLIVYVFVFVGQLRNICLLYVFSWVDNVQLISLWHAVTWGKKSVSIVGKRNRTEISNVVGELYYFSTKVCLIQIYACVPASCEIKFLGISGPAIAVDIWIERFGNVFLRLVCYVVNAQTVAIALITVACHTLPCYVFAVRRECRIYVIT